MHKVGCHFQAVLLLLTAQSDLKAYGRLILSIRMAITAVMEGMDRQNCFFQCSQSQGLSAALRRTDRADNIKISLSWRLNIFPPPNMSYGQIET
jgi:hypothetical protein